MLFFNFYSAIFELKSLVYVTGTEGKEEVGAGKEGMR